MSLFCLSRSTFYSVFLLFTLSLVVLFASQSQSVTRRVHCLQVDLRFPQSGSADPNLVTVTGRPELVDEAIDHLLNLEEEYVSFPCTMTSK